MVKEALVGEMTCLPAEHGRGRRLMLGGLLLVSMALHALVLVPFSGHLGSATPRAVAPPEPIRVVLLQPDSSLSDKPRAMSPAKPIADVRRADTAPAPRALPPATPGPIEPSSSSVIAETASVANEPILSGDSSPAVTAASASPAATAASVRGDTVESTGALPSPFPGMFLDVSPEGPAGSGVPGGLAAGQGAEAPLPGLPGSRTQRFRVYWGDFSKQQSVARLEYRLVNQGDRYELRTDVRAEGLISLVYSGTLSQVSVGSLGPDGLEPARYVEIRSKSSERVVDFDRKLGQLMSLDGRSPVPMPVGTQDRLSVFYQLGLMMRREPSTVTAGQVIDMPVASMRSVQRERFVVVGEEMLMLPGGPIRALHLQRPVPAGSRDPRIDLWLGYDFEMMPVRLRLEESTDRVLDQVIDRAG
jgi:hypothetical protein